MSRAAPLPQHLRNRAFTVFQAREAGLSRSRLQCTDIDSIARGLYAHGGQPSVAAIVAGLSLLHRGIWASHGTAAGLLGLHLPWRRAGDTQIQLSRARALPPLAIEGVIVHRALLLPGEARRFRAPDDGPPHSDVPVASRERTWLDLAGELDVRDLVAMGDQLVRHPRERFEGRTRPWSTPDRLAALLASHPGFRGVVRAREALTMVRIGADSPAETRLRLALVAAGLPDPELQLKLDPGAPSSPAADLGYRRARIAVQYDGDHHRSRDQLASDNRRDMAFTLAGWTYLKFDWTDDRDGFRRAVGLVGRALAQAGRGQAAPGPGPA